MTRKKYVDDKGLKDWILMFISTELVSDTDNLLKIRASETKKELRIQEILEIKKESSWHRAPSVSGSSVWTIGCAVALRRASLRVSNYRMMRAPLENGCIGNSGITAGSDRENMVGEIHFKAGAGVGVMWIVNCGFQDPSNGYHTYLRMLFDLRELLDVAFHNIEFINSEKRLEAANDRVRGSETMEDLKSNSILRSILARLADTCGIFSSLDSRMYYVHTELWHL
ncbi:hypothetical protein WN51_08763 [Melipona quadrifasciata]|uniref:Uncharacterized protein n=1 Tax=Melipona quadrifasciata TaxID=166423 RepID=A0A0N0BBS2_9HYME|nr:hypothetical protein WN51_08763 [Melipona quadrifasciata]